MSILHHTLITLLATTNLTLTDCTLNPQQLTPQPKLTNSLTPMDQNQPIIMHVIDGRPSPMLGTRDDLYPETNSKITQSSKPSSTTHYKPNSNYT